MNTILTDDERKQLWAEEIDMPNWRINGERFARAVEAAVLAKLAQQEPVAYLNKRGFLTVFDAVSPYQYRNMEQWEKAHYDPLYLHQVPQQADPIIWECKSGGLKPLTQKQYEAQPEKIRRHYSRLADRRPVPDWRPIETAPKDATAILVMRDIWPGTESGRAEECNGHNTYVAQWWGGEKNGAGAWICYMDAVCDPECPIEPTHWMPLPAPPSAPEAPAEPVRDDRAAPEAFTDWLCHEMPPGTIISDPAWWAPKITRAMLAAAPEAPARSRPSARTGKQPRDLLSSRLRAGSECAPWVIDEVLRLESALRTALAEPEAQASAVDERAAFEAWYSQNAFNFERDPIGSRDCGLQWMAWQARAALAQKGGAA